MAIFIFIIMSLSFQIKYVAERKIRNHHMRMNILYIVLTMNHVDNIIDAMLNKHVNFIFNSNDQIFTE